jgi:hypothetical protein
VLHSDNNPREEYGSIAVSLLIVLHNGFYAFAFEFVVVTTCKLALYIIFSVTVHFLHTFLLTQAFSSTSSPLIFGHPCTLCICWFVCSAKTFKMMKLRPRDEVVDTII